MLSFRRRGHRPISEVDSSLHQLVYDFRRRTNLLFENYRSVNYRKPESYNLEQLKKEIENTLKTLIDASAVDAGNKDCLIDKILGPVRDASDIWMTRLWNITTFITDKLQIWKFTVSISKKFSSFGKKKNLL